MQIISKLINEKILTFVKKVNKEFPLISVNGMLAILRKQQNLPFSTFDELDGAPESDFQLSIPVKEKMSLSENEDETKKNSKSCQHMYIKGRNANIQCAKK